MREFEVYVSPDGTVFSPWWHGELALIVCSLCGRQGEVCLGCDVLNPWCG
ncbi:MAG: hypothetical protein AB1330_01530 [Bacillota bacterium]